MSKQIIRDDILSQRQALSEVERTILCAKWASTALNFISTLSFKSIAGYYPIRAEIDVLPLLQAISISGERTLLPRTPEEPAPLTFHEYEEDELENGKFGIKQPQKTNPTFKPDIILLPLAACDNKGNRIGYGGGYYDRTIAELSPRPLLVGCAYSFQIVDDITNEPHDEKLDIIITPSRAIDCRA